MPYSDLLGYLPIGSLEVAAPPPPFPTLFRKVEVDEGGATPITPRQSVSESDAAKSKTDNKNGHTSGSHHIDNQSVTNDHTFSDNIPPFSSLASI